MIKINPALCVGCGKCVDDCISDCLVLRDGKAVYRKRCIKCGHCVAICPKRAVSIPAYDMSDVEEYDENAFRVDPKHLLRTIKFRRSVRDFRQDDVEADKIKDIINAGRSSPSASNRQDWHFYVIQEGLRDFKRIIWDSLERQLEGKVNMPRDMLRPVSRFCDMRRKDPANDYLFRNAPVVLFLECNTELDAGVAAQNMELVAVAHGLGVMYDQYLSYVTKINREALQFLGTHGEKFLVAMLLGYPELTFRRTAPRKNTNITWK